MTNEQILERISELFPYLAENSSIDKDHPVVNVPVEKIAKVLAVLRDDDVLDFKMFMDFTIVDWLDRDPRFELVYHLYSVTKNIRLRLKVGVKEGQQVASVTNLWPIADWLEREMCEFYGVKFSGHPNLKKLLMYDDFKGFPLRKDYPYKKRQPRMPETFPSKPYQHIEKDLKIHRGE